MAEASEPQVVVARTSAEFEFEGRKVRITRGRTTVEVGHPILKGRAHLFDPFTVDYPLPQRRVRAAA